MQWHQNSYGWDVRNIPKINLEMAKKVIFRLHSNFSKTVHTIRTKFFKVILNYIRVLFVEWHQNRMAAMRET